MVRDEEREGLARLLTFDDHVRQPRLARMAAGVPPDAAAQATLTYLTHVSLFLAPLPRYSSALSQTLAQLSPGPTTHSDVQCRGCKAVLVGGINSSFRMGGGKLWSRCEGCGHVTGERGDGTGKAAFEGVKRKALVELVKSRKAGRGKGGKDRSRTISTAPSAATTATPAIPAVKETTKAVAIPTTATKIPARLVPAAPSTSNHIIPATTPSEADSRSKKRPKKQSGLAQLLEAKRKEKESEEKKKASTSGLFGWDLGM